MPRNRRSKALNRNNPPVATEMVVPDFGRCNRLHYHASNALFKEHMDKDPFNTDLSAYQYYTVEITDDKDVPRLATVRQNIVCPITAYKLMNTSEAGQPQTSTQPSTSSQPPTSIQPTEEKIKKTVTFPDSVEVITEEFPQLGVTLSAVTKTTTSINTPVTASKPASDSHIGFVKPTKTVKLPDMPGVTYSEVYEIVYLDGEVTRGTMTDQIENIRQDLRRDIVGPVIDQLSAVMNMVERCHENLGELQKEVRDLTKVVYSNTKSQKEEWDQKFKRLTEITNQVCQQFKPIVVPTPTTSTQVEKLVCRPPPTTVSNAVIINKPAPVVYEQTARKTMVSPPSPDSPGPSTSRDFPPTSRDLPSTSRDFPSTSRASERNVQTPTPPPTSSAPKNVREQQNAGRKRLDSFNYMNLAPYLADTRLYNGPELRQFALCGAVVHWYRSLRRNTLKDFETFDACMPRDPMSITLSDGRVAFVVFDAAVPRSIMSPSAMHDTEREPIHPHLHPEKRTPQTQYSPIKWILNHTPRSTSYVASHLIVNGSLNVPFEADLCDVWKVTDPIVILGRDFMSMHVLRWEAAKVVLSEDATDPETDDGDPVRMVFCRYLSGVPDYFTKLKYPKYA